MNNTEHRKAALRAKIRRDCERIRNQAAIVRETLPGSARRADMAFSLLGAALRVIGKTHSRLD